MWVYNPLHPGTWGGCPLFPNIATSAFAACRAKMADIGAGGGGSGGNNYLNSSGAGGGGTGIYGKFYSGIGGINLGNPGSYCGPISLPGGGGSFGQDGSVSVFGYRNASSAGAGGLYGGGGGGATVNAPGAAAGAGGAVRIVWPGNTRTFPSTNVFPY
jgi:hypothetical protein